jgi:hypothetical protein
MTLLNKIFKLNIKYILILSLKLYFYFLIPIINDTMYFQNKFLTFDFFEKAQI